MMINEKRKGLRRVWGQITKERAEYEGLLIAALGRLHGHAETAAEAKKVAVNKGEELMAAYANGQHMAYTQMLEWLQTEYNKLKLR